MSTFPTPARRRSPSLRPILIAVAVALAALLLLSGEVKAFLSLIPG